MEFTAEMIAAFLEGEVVGNKDAKVWSMGKIEESATGDIAFLSNPKYTHYIYDCQASIIIVNRDFKPEREVQSTMIKVDDAYGSFAKLLDLYVANMPQKNGRSPLAVVAEGVEVDEQSYIGEFAVISTGVKLGKNVKIYPQVYISDNVTIGDNVTLYSGVKIYPDCVIGNRAIIHSGAVIGADGFGFAPINDVYKKIPQIGNVILEDDVEIGANTCVDRATMGSTVIKRGVKLDNLVQIGHNATIGENTVMAAQCGIAGSSKIGSNCMLGGQVGVAGHLSVANGVQMGSKTGISNNVKQENEVMLGFPAMKASRFNRSYVIFKHLPEMSLKLTQLENDMKKLTAEISDK